MFEDARRLSWTELLVALMLGGFAAFVSSFVLFGMSKTWFVLVTGSIAIGIGCLLTTDLTRFWLAILLATIPIKLGKIFANSDDVQQWINDHHLPPGALPVFNIILPDIPFYVLLVIAFVNLARTRGWPRAHPVIWAAFAAVGWAGLSISNADLQDAAWWELYRLAQYVFFAIMAMYAIRSRADLRTVFYVVAISVAIQGVLCVGNFAFDLNSYLFPSEVTEYGSSQTTNYTGEDVSMAGEEGALAGHRRGTGTVGHANQTAQYFEFWLPWVLAAAIAARSWGLRLLMWLSLTVTLTGLVFTFSRGGAIAISIGLAATFCALVRGRFVPRRYAWGALGLIFLAAVALSPAAYYYLTTRPNMFEDRFWLLKVAWAMIKDHPMLGVGLNQSMAVFNDYDYKMTGTPERIHLYYAALAAERGVPGLLLFAIFYLAAWRRAWKNTRSADPAASLGSAAAFGALSAALVHMSFDLFFGMPSQWSIWLNAGFAIACGRMQPDPNPDALALGARPIEPGPAPPLHGPAPQPAFARSG